MSIKTLALGSASLAIIAILSTPAAAQVAAGSADPTAQTSGTQPAPPTSTDPAGYTGQAGSAGPDTASPGAAAAQPPAEAEAEQAIVVTGLRRSLQSAQQLKRNSDVQLDAIVAQDIGKLPDVAVSDTAARIPGILVERSGGEAFRAQQEAAERTKASGGKPLPCADIALGHPSEQPHPLRDTRPRARHRPARRADHHR